MVVTNRHSASDGFQALSQRVIVVTLSHSESKSKLQTRLLLMNVVIRILWRCDVIIYRQDNSFTFTNCLWKCSVCGSNVLLLSEVECILGWCWQTIEVHYDRPFR